MSETTAEAAPRKSCDRCRSRKVRCNRGSPCSNCQRAKAQCKTSPRVSKPRQRRVLLPSEYEGKLGDLDKRLDQMGRFMDILASNNAPRRMANDSNLPAPSLPNSSTNSPPVIDPQASNTQSPQQECRSIPHHPNRRISASPEHDDQRVAEGSSSLSANSTFAIDLLHRVAGEDRERGHDFETRDLLDMLQRIVNAIKHDRVSAGQSFPLAPPLAQAGRDDCMLPPIHAAVAAIRKAQEQSNNIALPFLNELLQSSLSDLCLKVYFSQDYSDAEYIILNFALYYLLDENDIGPIDQQRSGDSSDRYRPMCQTCLEAALARLPLCFKPTYDMVLALALGTIYAVEISKPALAWVYASAAQQTSYSLGFHTRLGGADDGCDVPNQMGLLFWMIYYLEKTLCLRLGRGSSILEIEITVPMPASSDPVMSYCRQQVRFASLAGRTYENLYSPNALSQSDEVRRQRVSELSQELGDISTEIRLATTNWLRTTADKQRQELINFIATSDEVVCLSMRTLVLRAALAQPDSRTTFTSDCVHAARAALECHQANMPALRKVAPPLLSSYLHWTILFSPFIPFIVLFCHTIETGNAEDLDRMHTFVSSLESACQHSSAIEKHHDLFQVFYNVTVRYTELKLSSTPSHPELAEHRVEMGSYLSELGFQAQHGTQDAASEGGQAVSTEFLPITLPHDVSKGHEEAGQAAQLANWYAVSQQMMGLLDSNQLLF